MSEQNKIAPEHASEMMGELARLAAELGSPDLAELTAPRSELDLGQVRNVADLRRFLQCYCEEVLIPLEWPVIRRSYEHAERSQALELIALDASLGHEPRLRRLARASQHVGRSQLRKLRPMRDQRFVRRYIAAVEDGSAQAWHTVVFGMVLALFSLPLRQGLVHYATETLNGFIHAAAPRLELSQKECEALVHEFLQPLPRALDSLLQGGVDGLRLIA